MSDPLSLWSIYPEHNMNHDGKSSGKVIEKNAVDLLKQSFDFLLEQRGIDDESALDSCEVSGILRVGSCMWEGHFARKEHRVPKPELVMEAA